MALAGPIYVLVFRSVYNFEYDLNITFLVTPTKRTRPKVIPKKVNQPKKVKGYQICTTEESR